MHLTTRRIWGPESCDVDGDGKKERIEIVETGSQVRLAHWSKKIGEGRSRHYWAVASTLTALRDEAFRQRADFPVAAGAVPFGVRPLAPADKALPAEKPQYLYFIDREPKDPDFNLQRNAFDLIQLTKAWDIQTGKRDVKVAIVDTGIAYRHPDLQSNIASTSDASILGGDFQTGSLDPDDAHWHGTFCAGLVGAVGGDGFGMTGVCWEVSLMPIKALGEEGFGTSAQAAAGIRYAVDNNADVILCAWGSDADSPDLKEALEYARSKKVVVVAAAGNVSSSESDVHFPASYSKHLDNIISVGATNAKDQALPTLAPAHLYAPGAGVYSTFPPHLRPYVPYHIGGGTSAAAALVAGACALLKAEDKSIPPAALRTLLVKTAKSINSADDKPSTAVRLNVAQALKGLSKQGPEAYKAEPAKEVRRSKKPGHFHRPSRTRRTP